MGDWMFPIKDYGDINKQIDEALGLTATIAVTPPCCHHNGWYIKVKFWIFHKKIFVCSDCGEHWNAK